MTAWGTELTITRSHSQRLAAGPCRLLKYSFDMIIRRGFQYGLFSVVDTETDF
jgi:hypothetical protein